MIKKKKYLDEILVAVFLILSICCSFKKNEGRRAVSWSIFVHVPVVAVWIINKRKIGSCGQIAIV